MKLTFTHLLALLFIHEKLAGNIDWAWWWVLSPLAVGLVIAMAVGAVQESKKK